MADGGGRFSIIHPIKSLSFPQTVQYKKCPTVITIETSHSYEIKSILITAIPQNSLNIDRCFQCIFGALGNCGMYVPLSDDKHQMVRDSSKKCTGQHGPGMPDIIF